MSDSAPQSAPSGEDAITAIRAEIDRVDSSILALIAERLKLAEGLAGPKQAAGQAFPVRPAREVSLLRRLIEAAPESVDSDLIIEVWRALIAANIRRQAPTDVVVGGGNDQVRLFDIARRHFGARTRIHRAPDPQTALVRAAEQPNTLAVAPWLASPGVGSWWPALSESRFSKLRLIAGLPLRGAPEQDPEACVFANVRTEPAGGDITLLIVFDPHHRAQRALAELDLAGREVARSEPRALLRIDAFLADDDARIGALTRYGLDGVRLLGSYARI